jgi:AAA domain
MYIAVPYSFSITHACRSFYLDTFLSIVTISIGKRVVIVDGVGYPSVGSICNLSNAHIAQALGSPVLLIGKPGVGDAVDSFNINAKYFESYGSLKFDAFSVFQTCMG